MGYRDDFYLPINIIGFTGYLNLDPTVYFRDGNSFGRITQKHDHADNVGRNKVRVKSDYRIYNKAGSAEEYYGGLVRHKSRHLFTDVDDFYRPILAYAIKKFENIKTKYS